MRACAASAVLAAALLIAGPAAGAEAGAGEVAPAPWVLPAAAAIVALGAVLIVRRVDVRMVLLLSATPLYLLTGRFPEMLRIIARTLFRP